MKLVMGKPGRILFAAMETGKPRRFKIEAYDGGPLPVDGFDLPVIVDLASLEYPGSIPILIDHTADVEHTLGSTDSIVNTGAAILEEGIVTATSATAVDVVAQADKGQQWQASIGVRVGDLQEIAAGQIVNVNKQSFRGPVYVARNSQMYETSVLPAGADWTTTVNLAARAARLLKGTAKMSFEDWVKSLGIDPASLSEDNKAAMTLAYDAVQNPPAAPPVTPVAAAPAPAPCPPVVDPKQMQAVQAKAAEDIVAGMANSAHAELNRQTQIALLCKGHPAIQATAIKDRWTPERTEIAVLKENAKIENAPMGFVRGGAPQITENVLLAAVCQARKIPNIEKQFDSPTLEAAHKTFRGDIGLQRLLIHAACSNGYQASYGEKITNGNLRNVLKAAFSTVSLPGTLSNLANKELLAGYEADDQLLLWREIAQIKSVSDFKTATSYRLLDASSYEELGPGGKIKHGSISEESYTRQAKTYAKGFSLTRTDIINDDLGAFDDMRKRLGMGAAMKLSDVFWQQFMSSSLFTAGRGNYISGSTTNLGTDGVGLGLAVKAFRIMRSPTADGSKRVGGEPELLMVPPELAVIAEQFYKNQNYGSGTTVANANVYANKYKPLMVPWLSDSSFTNNSSTAFYLFRNPARYAPMVVSFLNGQEQPTVESADADFDELGVRFRGFFDVGCDPAEYLAGLQSKGAA